MDLPELFNPSGRVVKHLQRLPLTGLGSVEVLGWGFDRIMLFGMGAKSHGYPRRLFSFLSKTRYSRRIDAVEVKAQEVRLPAKAAEAVAEGTPVAVTRYGQRTLVLLSDREFSLVEPMLEMLKKGITVSPEMLMTEDDVELMRDLATDREPGQGEAAQLGELIAAELG